MKDEIDATCVFCAILRGEVTPGVLAYCDNLTAAFPSLHQQPKNQGHILVVPTLHVAHIYSIGGDLAGALMTTLARVATAVKAVCSSDGVTIRQNNERHGGQDVFHVHFHVIPRFAGDAFEKGADRFPFGAVEVPLKDRIEQAQRVAEALEAGSTERSGSTG